VRQLSVLLLVSALLAVPIAFTACGSPAPATTPSPTPAPAPTPTPAPTPAPTTAGLQGTVANNAGAPVTGARVAVIDGPNAGQAATTNANGSYRFESLSIANMNFSANATGYQEDRQGTFVNGTNVLNFTLTPVPPPPPPPPPPSAPTITITARQITGGTGSPTQEWGFTATSSAMFTSYDWSFGDGGSAVDSFANEQHVYRSKGTFTVTVTGRRSGQDPIIGTLSITIQ
jgi:PKD repeat protein